MKDSFIFYRSFYEAAEDMDDNDRLKFYEAIFELGLNEREIPLTGRPKGLFVLAKPQVTANNKKYKDGQKGGRPSKKEIEKTTGFATGETTGFENKKPNVNENDNENDTENVNVYKKAAKAATPQKQTYGEFGNVKLTDEEHGKLVQRLGKDKTADYIERLDGWLAEGNQKKNHYATILNWYRKDEKKPVPQAFTNNSFNIDKIEELLRGEIPD